tara:strand:- start:133 stop:348 length:216 start_codon:yes stop_codon:yes gene_type:complete
MKSIFELEQEIDDLEYEESEMAPELMLMRTSMLNKKLLRTKAIVSKKDSTKFSLNKMINNHIEIYKKLIFK